MNLGFEVRLNDDDAVVVDNTTPEVNGNHFLLPLMIVEASLGYCYVIVLLVLSCSKYTRPVNFRSWKFKFVWFSIAVGLTEFVWVHLQWVVSNPMGHPLVCLWNTDMLVLWIGVQIFTTLMLWTAWIMRCRKLSPKNVASAVFVCVLVRSQLTGIMAILSAITGTGPCGAMLAPIFIMMFGSFLAITGFCGINASPRTTQEVDDLMTLHGSSEWMKGTDDVIIKSPRRQDLENGNDDVVLNPAYRDSDDDDDDDDDSSCSTSSNDDNNEEELQRKNGVQEDIHAAVNLEKDIIISTRGKGKNWNKQRGKHHSKRRYFPTFLKGSVAGTTSETKALVEVSLISPRSEVKEEHVYVSPRSEKPQIISETVAN